MAAVLVDAGPLIALLDRSDYNHDRCVKTLRALRDPLVTVWPAFTEAMYLLRFSWDAQEALWEMLDTEALRLVTVDHADLPRIRHLMQKYRIFPWILRTRRWSVSPNETKCGGFSRWTAEISWCIARKGWGGFLYYPYPDLCSSTDELLSSGEWSFASTERSGLWRITGSQGHEVDRSGQSPLHVGAPYECTVART